MKLFFFIDSMEMGGAERVTAILANEWVGRGWDITIVTSYSIEDDYYYLNKKIKRISLNFPVTNNRHVAEFMKSFYRIVLLRKTIKEKKPNIVVAMMCRSNITLSFATIGLKEVITVGVEHAHPPQLPDRVMREWLRKLCYPWLTAMCVLTQETADWILQKTKSKKVTIIPNPVDWPMTSQKPIINPKVILPSDKKILLAVGRLRYEKGFDILISAFSLLVKKHLGWMLVIVGEGGERESLESLINYHNLNDQVILPGVAGNIGQWYEAADLYVMSSRYEGFPMTLVEAMAHGLAAVSFDCNTGPRDIIRHGVDGLLVKGYDPRVLSQELYRLMSDDELRKQYSTRAIEARDRFSSKRIVDQWEGFFHKLQ